MLPFSPALCCTQKVWLSRPYFLVRHSIAKFLSAANACARFGAVYEIFGLTENNFVMKLFNSHSRTSLPSDMLEIYTEDNVLLLTNPGKFQNTTVVPGARYFPAVSSRSFGARNYFAGYVFRGDGNPIQTVLEAGFVMPSPFTPIDQARGASDDVTWSIGVSTSICAQACAEFHPPRHLGVLLGYVYLIDALNFTGFAIPAPHTEYNLALRFPIIQKICEVNFTHTIPNTSIIGVVWPENMPRPRPFPWPSFPKALRLAVNPEYEGGMKGAREVVELFNTS